MVPLDCSWFLTPSGKQIRQFSRCEVYLRFIFEVYLRSMFYFVVFSLKRIFLGQTYFSFLWGIWRGFVLSGTGDHFFCATCILHLYYYGSYCLLHCLTVQRTKTYPFSKNPLCLHLVFFFFNQNLLTIFPWDWHLAFILLSSKDNTEAFIHSEEILFVQTVK